MAALRTEEIGPEDIAASVLYSLLYFKGLGGTDNVAKGKELIGKLKEVSERFVALDSKSILESLAEPSKQTAATE